MSSFKADCLQWTRVCSVNCCTYACRSRTQKCLQLPQLVVIYKALLWPFKKHTTTIQMRKFISTKHFWSS